MLVEHHVSRAGVSKTWPRSQMWFSASLRGLWQAPSNQSSGKPRILLSSSQESILRAWEAVHTFSLYMKMLMNWFENTHTLTL